jgi:hypothetical protein
MLKQWFKFALVPAFALATNVYAATPIGYGLTESVQTVSRDISVNPTGSFSFEEIFSLNLTSPNYIFASITEDKRYPYYDINDSSLSYGLFLNNAPVALSNTTIYGIGAYELRVSGIATGSSGGQYFLNINVSTTPVPEPSSALFMLFGIGVLASRKLNFFK